MFGSRNNPLLRLIFETMMIQPYRESRGFKEEGEANYSYYQVDENNMALFKKYENGASRFWAVSKINNAVFFVTDDMVPLIERTPCSEKEAEMILKRIYMLREPF